MSASRVFLLFAFMGGMVLLAECSANRTRGALIGSDTATWGPPLVLQSQQQSLLHLLGGYFLYSSLLLEILLRKFIHF